MRLEKCGHIQYLLKILAPHLSEEINGVSDLFNNAFPSAVGA
jgi:hypothetical protein